MPIRCADLPSSLEGGGYTFTFENSGAGGTLFVYNTGGVDFGGSVGQNLDDVITVHVSAHADTGQFTTLHLTPDRGAWQRLHLRYVNGSFQREEGRNFCRDIPQLDAWLQEMADTLDAAAAAFWNAAEARGAHVQTELDAGNARPAFDESADVNDMFAATYEMERNASFVDTSEPDPEAVPIDRITDVGGQAPVLVTDDGAQVLGQRLPGGTEVIFRGPFMLGQMFFGVGLVYRIDGPAAPRLAQPGE